MRPDFGAGYVSIFPFLLKLLPPESQAVGSLLAHMRWAWYGLRVPIPTLSIASGDTIVVAWFARRLGDACGGVHGGFVGLHENHAVFQVVKQGNLNLGRERVLDPLAFEDIKGLSSPSFTRPPWSQEPKENLNLFSNAPWSDLVFWSKYHRDPTQLWSPHGLRSLSASDPLYQVENNPGDEPYWRGHIWVNVNYLALAALRHYSQADGPFRQVQGSQKNLVPSWSCTWKQVSPTTDRRVLFRYPGSRGRLRLDSRVAIGSNKDSGPIRWTWTRAKFPSGGRDKWKESLKNVEVMFSYVVTACRRDAGRIYSELRANLLRTLLGGYHSTGYFWEQYDDRSGPPIHRVVRSSCSHHGGNILIWRRQQGTSCGRGAVGAVAQEQPFRRCSIFLRIFCQGGSPTFIHRSSSCRGDSRRGVC